MSDCQSNPLAAACPPTVEELQRQARERLDEIIAYCSEGPRARVFPRVRGGAAGAPAVAGVPADPALPPGPPRPARPGGLADPRLSRGGPRRRADAQDQLRAGRLCPGVPRAAVRRRARRAPPGRGAGPDPRRLHPAGHRLVLPAGHPGEFPGRQRSRGDVPGGRAAGLGDRGVGPGLGPARLRLPQRRPLARRTTARCWSSRSTARRPPRPRSRSWRGDAARGSTTSRPASASGIGAGPGGGAGAGRSGGRRGTRARTAAAPRWW